MNTEKTKKKMGEEKNRKKQILFLASEAVPYIKTGGLADVVGSLPGNIDPRYFDCRVMLPEYACLNEGLRSSLKYLKYTSVCYEGRDRYVGILTAEHEGVTYYFIDNKDFFSGSTCYGDWLFDLKKFCFFDKAALAAIKTIGFKPDIIHCHDWQTGLVPVYLRELSWADEYYRGIKTVFTVHNLKFQGSWGLPDMIGITELPACYFTAEGLEFYGGGNMLKGGIVYSNAVTTVSRTYAEEIKTPEYGEGLDGLMRAKASDIRGIVNGIDYREFDPENDERIAVRYSPDTMRRKKKLNKRALQRELGLREDPGAFLIGMVSRLTDQKGLDLIAGVMDRLFEHDIQLAVVGTGDRRYEDMFLEAAWRYGGRAAVSIKYSDILAHRVYAGADAYLMPSRFEPCGLSQLIALRYGAVPVVRETGGLKDTVIPYNRYTGEGTGFSFANYSKEEMLDCILYAEETYRHHKISWNRIAERGMRADFSWRSSALSYQELYDWLIGR